MRLTPILGAATVLGAYAYWSKKQHRPLEVTDHSATVGPYGHSDGTSQRWNAVDKTIDESFPASDPPGNY